MGLTTAAFGLVRGRERTDGKLGQRDGGDGRFRRQRIDIDDPRQPDDRVHIEHARLMQGVHKLGSNTSSVSERSRSGSTVSRRRQRSSKADASSGRRGNGRNSATGRPDLVTVSRSPACTRSTTLPSWLRSCRIVALSIAPTYRQRDKPTQADPCRGPNRSCADLMDDPVGSGDSGLDDLATTSAHLEEPVVEYCERVRHC